MIEDTYFVNNFGDNGASINLDQGGSIYCIRCSFYLNSTEFSVISENYGELIETEKNMNPVVVGFPNESVEELYKDNKPLTKGSELLI